MTRFQSWVLGYPDQLSVRPGDTVTFHVSGEGADTFDAQLVRLIHGDTQPAGPGFKEIEVPSAVDGTHPLLSQLTHHGSYARIPDAGGLVDRAGEGLSLFAMVQPLIETGPQPVITVWDEAADVGIALVLEPELRLALWLGGPAGIERVALQDGLLGGVWYAVCGSWDPVSSSITVRAMPVVNSYNSRFGPLTQVKPLSATSHGSPPSPPQGVDLLLGAFDASDGRVVRGSYNGKLALPSVYGRALSAVELEALSGSAIRPSVTDGLRAMVGPEPRDRHNASGRRDARRAGWEADQPARSRVTAHNWDGSCYEWPHAPEQYGAIHFHDDDIDDIGWSASCALEIPDRPAVGRLRPPAQGRRLRGPHAVLRTGAARP